MSLATTTPAQSASDDIVAAFSLDRAPVRGRTVRVGAGALDPILRRHDYPRPVAMLLGEALTLAALVGSLLKAEGRLVVQAQGEGPVALLVAEYTPGGGLRGYARMAEGAADKLSQAKRMAPATLLGAGNLVLTLDQGENKTSYQGVVPLDGETLAACAENYFRVSEQTDTCIRLAVGEVYAGDAPPLWRAGGMLMQRLAGDEARGDTGEDWNRASLLFATLRDEELIDPALPADRLLYRLFHEEGARMDTPTPLEDRCTCDEERLTNVMRQFPKEELHDLIEPDGMLHARCQFCSRQYLIDPKEVGAA
ncbi:MAG TPA: Hsp33 family molecular chaperone HslO [Vitreimonas sp.]|uniref:Hsp33 family molecular chaperone HslO n=1 Tax=Vitreimonas sp. TaxID=3069702 RepID=UPI002D684E98|nr:Hsp33 family molecular chaperone HslO [Vitreimonas sp.]HYD88904.1 Hsp33 family molecular chaperone HslO [Vitreimonas sp.]